MKDLKAKVRDYWGEAACGEALYLDSPDREGYDRQAVQRYELEPYIAEFARFDDSRGQRVLEVGVGLGADHQRFACAGADLHGIDLTARAIDHTRRRLSLFGLASQLRVGDAEHLAFPDNHFDVVYSWGVMHHSPDTGRAISELWRVLKPGGSARIMMYHKWSLVGLMLWARYGLLRFKPWSGLDRIYSEHLESPGTKAYSITDARALFRNYSLVDIAIQLSHGDLLAFGVGQRHRGRLLTIARRLWPRWALRRLARRHGLFMLITARK